MSELADRGRSECRVLLFRDGFLGRWIVLGCLLDVEGLSSVFELEEGEKRQFFTPLFVEVEALIFFRKNSNLSYEARGTLSAIHTTVLHAKVRPEKYKRCEKKTRIQYSIAKSVGFKR